MPDICNRFLCQLTCRFFSNFFHHTIHILALTSVTGNPQLFGFLVIGMMMTEATKLLHLQPFRIIFFVLHCIIIPLLAITTSQGYLYSHYNAPPTSNFPYDYLKTRIPNIIYHNSSMLSIM